MEKTIALAGNYSYIRQIETTIKSVLFHNVNITFYLMNNDIPQDWFKMINTKINPIGSEIIDKKVDPTLLNNEHISQQHLDVIAYAKFFVPELVTADTVIYIDSDTIITGNLDSLFELTFSDDELVAAAREIENQSVCNHGVIVYNNKRLRKIKGLTSHLLELGQNDNLYNGDQSVFNKYFDGKIKVLPDQYNYEAGMDSWAYMQSRTDMQEKLEAVDDPIIIHYANNDKPWNNFSSGRMREIWWKYYATDWTSIVEQTNRMNVSLRQIKVPEIKKHLFTFTNDQSLEQLEQLVQHLPECEFHICAYTHVGWQLARMVQYPNVKVCPDVLSYRVNELIDTADLYLDINYGPKDEKIISKFIDTGKPLLAFDSVKDNNIHADNYHVFADDQIDKMINFINEKN